MYICALSLSMYIYINLDRLYGYAWVQVLFAVFWTFQNISRRYRHLGLGVGGWGVGEMSCVCDVRMWTDFCLVLFLQLFKSINVRIEGRNKSNISIYIYILLLCYIILCYVMLYYIIILFFNIIIYCYIIFCFVMLYYIII